MKFPRQKCEPFEEISKEEFQKRIRKNFPECWDENGKFKYDELAAFTKDGKHIFWHSNPDYLPLKNHKYMDDFRDRTLKVEIPHLKDLK